MFIAKCGQEVDDCLDKCVTNSQHSDSCKSIYDDAHSCATDGAPSCSDFDACGAVYNLDQRYRSAGCPR